MRGTVTRLSRLEVKRGPKADARFYVFGTDEEDAAERLAAEIRAGTIQPGDPCTMATWRHGDMAKRRSDAISSLGEAK
jgi:hypothetical protein